MSMVLNRANVLIADAASSPWSTTLADSLRPWPVDLHWSRSDSEVIDMVAGHRLHVAIVDGEMPGGGLKLLRRVRGLGLDLPCLLVCDTVDSRLLQEAIELDVFSVMAKAQDRLLRPMLFKLFRRVYRLDWTDRTDEN
jgi:DNA-binding NtrC family response regulator